MKLQKIINDTNDPNVDSSMKTIDCARKSNGTMDNYK
jgi:hypothetical protein